MQGNDRTTCPGGTPSPEANEIRDLAQRSPRHHVPQRFLACKLVVALCNTGHEAGPTQPPFPLPRHFLFRYLTNMLTRRKEASSPRSCDLAFCCLQKSIFLATVTRKTHEGRVTQKATRRYPSLPSTTAANLMSPSQTVRIELAVRLQVYNHLRGTSTGGL